MNRFFTILSASLAIPAFVYIFYPNKTIVAIVAGIAFIVSTALFKLEQFIKKNGSLIANAITYFFTRAEKYLVEEKKVVYERKSKTEWELLKRYSIKPLHNGFDEYDDRFCWSADSSKANILPIEAGQTISRIRDQERWTVYSVVFDRSAAKKKSVPTGSRINNLIDESDSVKPYLSITIPEKTSRLKISVKIPQQFTPKNGRFSVYSSASSSSEVFTKSIAYDVPEEAFSETVIYPRKNWRYVITWEY